MTDEAGYYTRTVSPFPTAMTTWSPELFFAGVSPISMGIVLPAIGAGRRAAQQVQAITQARGLQGACVLYAQGNKGKFPPDLGTLLIKDFFTVDYVISPRDTTVAPAQFSTWPKPKQAEWVNKNTSFILIPGGTDNIDMNRIDVVERLLPGNGGNLAVAYLDNHAAIRPIEDVRAQLLKQTGKTLEQLGIVRAAPANPPAPPTKPASSPAPAGTNQTSP